MNPPTNSSGGSSINVVLYGFNFYVGRVKVNVGQFQATLSPCGVHNLKNALANQGACFSTDIRITLSPHEVDGKGGATLMWNRFDSLEKACLVCTQRGACKFSDTFYIPRNPNHGICQRIF